MITESPFSRVPFLLPRSTTKNPSPSLRISAWWRDSHWSGRKMSLSRERPMVTRSLTMGNRSRAPSELRTVISGMGRPESLRPPALDREVPLAHADLGVLAVHEPDLDRAPGAVRALARRVGQGVVVVQLVGDAGEDREQLGDLVRVEEGPARLLGDLAQEAPGAAPEHPLLAADEDAVDGGLYGAGVVDDLLLAHAAVVVGAVGEDDDRLPSRLVLHPVEPVMDGVVERGPAPRLEGVHEPLQPV